MPRVLSGPDKIHSALKKLKNQSTAKEIELIELVADVYESVKEKQEQVVQTIKDTASGIDETVHAHPWKFIGGATLLGVIIGRFLLR